MSGFMGTAVQGRPQQKTGQGHAQAIAALVVFAVLLGISFVACSACSKVANGPTTPTGPPLATFSGGGADVTSGATDSFTVGSGSQVLTVAMPTKGTLASLGIFVISDATGMNADYNSFFGPGNFAMSLPAGTYHIVWQSGDCTWRMSVRE